MKLRDTFFVFVLEGLSGLCNTSCNDEKCLELFGYRCQADVDARGRCKDGEQTKQNRNMRYQTWGGQHKLNFPVESS